MDQLRIVYPHIPELLSHRVKLEEIDSKYNGLIAPVKDKLRQCEHDVSAIKRDLEKQRAEDKREIEQINSEFGRDSSGKKVKWSEEDREMLEERKHYLQRGRKLEVSNIDAIFAQEEKDYWDSIYDYKRISEKSEKSFSLLLEGAKKEIEYLKTMILLNDSRRNCERFAYIFKFVPAEKDLFGFTGKAETLSKSLAEAVEIIKIPVSDVFDSIAHKDFNISDLSYQQLAQLHYDYIEIIENWDIELVRAEGLLKSHSFALKANEVWGESENVERDREEYRILTENLKKRQADFDERSNQLRKKYVSFLQAACTAKLQSQNNVQTAKTRETALPVAQQISPQKPEPTDSPFHKEDQSSLIVLSSYGKSRIGSILETIVARHAFTDVGIICQSGSPIKNDKADKSRISFGIPDTDDIYFIASGQIMGGISETSKGFAITTSGIFYRKNGREQGFCDWKMFSNIRIAANTFTYIEIGAVEFQVSGQKKVLKLLLDLQSEIKNSVR